MGGLALKVETGPFESESLYSLSAVSIHHTFKTNSGITCYHCPRHTDRNSAERKVSPQKRITVSPCCVINLKWEIIECLGVIMYYSDDRYLMYLTHFI